MTEKIAKSYAINAHNFTNHTYNGLPYSHHLQMVVEVANEFIRFVPECDRKNVIMACWCHDLIEDCRETFNDVKKVVGAEVAEIVYALTNEKGKNRAERGNDKYYAGIRDTPGASFVKLCDRIANVKYSIQTQSRMVEMYRKENEVFLNKVFERNTYPQYRFMCEYLDKMLKEHE